jgi:hypothetical protein
MRGSAVELLLRGHYAGVMPVIKTALQHETFLASSCDHRVSFGNRACQRFLAEHVLAFVQSRQRDRSVDVRGCAHQYNVNVLTAHHIFPPSASGAVHARSQWFSRGKALRCDDHQICTRQSDERLRTPITLHPGPNNRYPHTTP